MSERALIIDDNLDNVNVLEELLSFEGIESVSILNPLTLSPVLNVNEAGFDVVFLDLEMPGMNGYEVLNELKKQSHLQDVPIVAYTVHAAEISEVRRRGFHSFLGKPLDADLFPMQIASILQGQPIWIIP